MKIGETSPFHSKWPRQERHRLASSTMPPTRLDVADSTRMLSFDDERWNRLMGGYKIPSEQKDGGTVPINVAIQCHLRNCENYLAAMTA
jgi:hypothetical protein